MQPRNDVVRAVHPHLPGSRRARTLLLALLCVAAPTGARAQRTPSLVGSYTAGTLAISFDSTGHYRVSMDGQLAVEGTYEVRADTVVLHDSDGPMACPPEESGRYTWLRTEGKLTLRVLSDGCEGRQDGAAREWTAVVSGPPAPTEVTYMDRTAAATASPG